MSSNEAYLALVDARLIAPLLIRPEPGPTTLDDMMPTAWADHHAEQDFRQGLADAIATEGLIAYGFQYRRSVEDDWEMSDTNSMPVLSTAQLTFETSEGADIFDTVLAEYIAFLNA